uniref:cilia- and flagella-associated protein 44-like isoform X2 n=1 Tax=Doryrhamphus excisus TaxID=161450 RepID=UPI0025AE1575|nr:cilia- and flagella-associated protein 44-like isoform X2 [Doryrhamphus excisus]
MDPAEAAEDASNQELEDEENADDKKKSLPVDMYYDYEELYTKPFITPDSEIPENLLLLSHSFGYDCERRANLQLLDDRTLIYIAGQVLILLDVSTKEQRYLRSCSGGGIGAIAVSDTKEYFAVAEKGHKPLLIVYEYPSIRAYRILREGTERAFCSVNFNSDGSLLASLGSTPDYMLTVWNWREEEVVLRCKAISQEVYRVSFSPYNPGLLTSSGSGHIKFWKMASTFTGLKLEGLIGHFGKTAATDIEGYIELPDGKVVSGSNWGNLLLWDGNAIKVELCSKGGQCCHAGVVQPFILEDGQLMTIGSDGAIRGWDFETIDSADSSSENSKFEMEPMTELVVGHQVCLSSIVKSSKPDSNVWFAQDTNGSIWKVDLSFTYSTPDPECLFSFHAGAIKGLDVSKKSHLMATTALDRSVRVFDFLAKTELTCSHFNQGGTALRWAPSLVNETGNLLVTGFEDGVVRLLELFDPSGLQIVTRHKVAAQLRLKQAFKPHNDPVTAVAYECNGMMLATGSSDCTVFFFTVGEKYEPVGFVSVPGPVGLLEWSPQSHNESRLLILCQSGHIVEVPYPDPKTLEPTKSYELYEVPRRFFCFKSIKSRIKRDEEIERRRALKEQRQKERKEKKITEEEEEEEEEPLPPIVIPDPPSPLHWGFYSLPGQFWLSMGEFDSGFLYHCKLSDNQDEDPDKRQDEPFDFVAIHNTDDDSIRSVTFSSNRELMLCGMHSGAIRIYPLDPDDHLLTSMQAYWELSIHDSMYGHLRNICCSHDDHFVLTAGEDGNIFSFSLLPHEELQKGLQRKKAKVPSPRVGLENEVLAKDIDDPSAYSIETAKLKLEKDRQQREAEKKISAKRKRLAEIQKMFKKLLNENLSLPEHIQLTPAEMLLDQRFEEQAEMEKTRRLKEVQFQMSWEEEHSHLALNKLQDWFSGYLDSEVITVFSIRTGHKVSAFHILPLSSNRPQQQTTSNEFDIEDTTLVERRKTRDQPVKDISSESDEEAVAHTQASRPGVQPADRQVERLQKATEKAEQARAKIAKRKQQWAKLYAEKPHKDCEDPRDVQAIYEAKETIGDLKLKTDKNFTVPKHLRMSGDKKKAEMIALEDNIREKQTEINREILALRDSKLQLVSKLRAQAQQLQKIQSPLPSRHRRHPPPLPSIQPEEIPDKRQRCNRAILETYSVLREQRLNDTRLDEQEEGVSVIDELEKQLGDKSCSYVDIEDNEATGEEEAELSEEELEKMSQDTLINMQDSLLEHMESLVNQFDKEHMICLKKVQELDWKLKLGNLRQLTLYQELLLLKEVDKSERVLQEKLNTRVKEENNLMSKLEEYREELELKRKDIAKVQEKDKSLTASFQALLGDDNNNFEEYLTKVFKKKIKRTKKKEHTGSDDEDEDSNDDFDDFENWDDDDDDDWDGLEGEGAAEECPAGCDLELFDHVLQLRERRLDLEELLAEEKKSADQMEKECDALVKKMKSVKISRKAAEDDLEQVNREKQQKMNQLDVVVPLRLHQIELDINDTVFSDLSLVLVLTRTELQRLRERVHELEVEKDQQKEVYRQARQQHIRLIKERKDMNNEIQSLEKLCHQLMMTRFGREVDMEILQTLCVNKSVAEMKQEKIFQDIANAKDIAEWDVKVEKAHEAVMAMTRSNTDRLHYLNNLFEQKKELEQKLYTRQKKIGKHLQECSRQADNGQLWGLQELVTKQAEQIEKLSAQISFFGPKGGHMLPSGHNHLPPLPSRPIPTVEKMAKKRGKFQTGKKNEHPIERQLIN